MICILWDYRKNITSSIFVMKVCRYWFLVVEGFSLYLEAVGWMISGMIYTGVL